MIAELKVYGNPSSKEPTKTYTVYRMTPHTWATVQDFMVKRFSAEELLDDSQEIVEKKYATYSEEEIAEDATRLLKIFFPEITDEELWMLDYGDGTGENGQVYEFINALNNYATAESRRSLKN